MSNARLKFLGPSVKCSGPLSNPSIWSNFTPHEGAPLLQTAPGLSESLQIRSRMAKLVWTPFPSLPKLSVAGWRSPTASSVSSELVALRDAPRPPCQILSICVKFRRPVGPPVKFLSNSVDPSGPCQIRQIRQIPSNPEPCSGPYYPPLPGMMLDWSNRFALRETNVRVRAL